MIFLGQTRFSELLESIEGINHKTLSIRLKDMVDMGLITKQIVEGWPPRTEYSLTEAGKGLRPILEQMAAYAMVFQAKKVFVDEQKRKYGEVFCESPKPFD